jgi:hypothetical protein
MKYEIRTNVINGNLKRNRNLILNALESFEGQEVILTIQKARKSRTNPQNSFYWGVVLQLVQSGLKDATGEFRTIENIHYNILLKMFAPENEIVNIETGECITEKITSSEMTTTQFAEYIMEIQKWSAEFLGISIPNPNEEITLI